jgi:hypothetical protein
MTCRLVTLKHNVRPQGRRGNLTHDRQAVPNLPSADPAATSGFCTDLPGVRRCFVRDPNGKVVSVMMHTPERARYPWLVGCFAR